MSHLSVRIQAIVIVVLLLFSSCKKYLDVKSESSLVIPETPDDLQALLDHSVKINNAGTPAAEISGDDFYVSTTSYLAQNENFRRLYTWEKDRLFLPIANDWDIPYTIIFIANNVLDNIDKVLAGNYPPLVVQNIKGQALFLRAEQFFRLATNFSLAYDPATAASEYGVALRLTGDINEKLTRATLEQTFSRITTDLKEAASGLVVEPVHVMRASRPAAYALLARVYLYMGDYDQAYKYADSCLALKSSLISYNTPVIANLDSQTPFSGAGLKFNNPEMIFMNGLNAPDILNHTNAIIDSGLIKLYEPGDNRKRVFFYENTAAGYSNYRFKGQYSGELFKFFHGIATDEVYLMRAEAAARLNRKEDALNDLNTLLKTRWDNQVTYVDKTAASADAALTMILEERRKSLVMRGLRWMDLKRLNKEGRQIILTRKVNDTDYTLPPNDLRYALAIPESIINFSGFPQNKR